MATKHDDSCFQRAEDDEELFTLLARDPIAPVLVREWAERAPEVGQPQERIEEALRCADKMDTWRMQKRPHKPPLPGARLVLPDTLTPALDDVLGLMTYQTGPISHAFRAAGHQIPEKCEREQAFVLFWLLKLVLEHGDDWRKAANEELKSARSIAEHQQAKP